LRSVDVIDDLVAEYERLDAILAGLTEQQWLSPSAAPGWSVCDVVLHLAQSEEAVGFSARNAGIERVSQIERGRLDERMADMVNAERAEPPVVFARWRTARVATVDALRNAAPESRLGWVTGSLKPATLATTRIAEHWAHGLDVTAPFDIPFPDTDRLRHVAWLGHSTLPWAFRFAGHEPRPVSCELIGPAGEVWRFGEPDTESTISGSAGAFCRVGAQRLAPEASGLRTAGPHAALALRVLRNYAG
jgi:uncharacterized protein (TIGR03084 family)